MWPSLKLFLVILLVNGGSALEFSRWIAACNRCLGLALSLKNTYNHLWDPIPATVLTDEAFRNAAVQRCIDGYYLRVVPDPTVSNCEAYYDQGNGFPTIQNGLTKFNDAYSVCTSYIKEIDPRDECTRFTIYDPNFTACNIATPCPPELGSCCADGFCSEDC